MTQTKQTKEIIQRHNKNMANASIEADKAANALYVALNAQGKDLKTEIRPQTDAIRAAGKAQIAAHESNLRAWLAEEGFAAAGVTMDCSGNKSQKFTSPEGVAEIVIKQNGVVSVYFTSAEESKAKARNAAEWARVDHQREQEERA